MHKPTFFLTLEEIAKLTNSKLQGNGKLHITGVAPLNTAGPSDIAFFADARYLEEAQKTQAGALFISPDASFKRNGPTLLTDNPKAAFAQLCDWVLSCQAKQPKQGFIHPSAVIAPSAHVSHDTTIGPHVVIEESARIEAGCTLSAGCYIGQNAQLGQGCHLFPHVTVLEGSVIGKRVILQSGVVIGSLGFGYKTDSAGSHTFIPHLGTVIIEDDVEIGANSTIDRAQLGSTLIGKGTKIDNQTHIAHNVTVGARNLIVAQVGIAGSSSTGDDVVLAGKVGVNDHVHLGSKVIVTAFSAVSKNLPQPGVYGGIPAEAFAGYKRTLIHVRKIGQYAERLEALENHLKS